MIVVAIVYQKNFRVRARGAVRCLMPCDRLSSPSSVMLRQLTIRIMRRIIVAYIFYEVKSRVMVWRAVRCLIPCDKLSSPSSVIL